MDIKDYLEQFDVTDKESQLSILICDPEPVPVAANMIWVDPKQLLKPSQFSQSSQSSEPSSSSQSSQHAHHFKDQTFNLTLCGHFLFLNGHLSEKDHLDTLLELIRISSEVRVAPLLDLHGQPSKHLGPILQALQEQGYGVELREIKSNQKPHKEALLRLWNATCTVQT